MTTAERWTVYPLLLLAIGLAIRGQLGLDGGGPARRTISADAVVCRELAVLGETDAIIIHAGRVEGGGGGRIEIRDADGTDTLALGTSAEARDGSIEFFDAKGTPVGRLGPRPAGDH